jgi:hypothetical protein
LLTLAEKVFYGRAGSVKRNLEPTFSSLSEIGHRALDGFMTMASVIVSRSGAARVTPSGDAEQADAEQATLAGSGRACHSRNRWRLCRCRQASGSVDEQLGGVGKLSQRCPGIGLEADRQSGVDPMNFRGKFFVVPGWYGWASRFERTDLDNTGLKLAA